MERTRISFRILGTRWPQLASTFSYNSHFRDEERTLRLRADVSGVHDEHAAEM